MCTKNMHHSEDYKETSEVSSECYIPSISTPNKLPGSSNVLDHFYQQLKL